MTTHSSLQKTLVLLSVVAAPLAVSGCTDRATTEPRSFFVEGEVGLASLISLSDGHLQQIANDFQLLASGSAARSADWDRIREPLAAVATLNVPALMWFALPDGSYWSTTAGKATGNLSDRTYWPTVMAGKPVMGTLVASKATGKSSAIVALPVRDERGSIVGVLGSSVYLDSLSLILKREIALQSDQIFFSIDATPIGALQDDPSEVFLDPFALGEPELERAIREMMATSEGVVNYSFLGRRRTVLYRKSPITGWWYAFGHVWQ